MKLMTFEEEITERVTANERANFARSLIGFGGMTDEQIATLTKQTPEYVASLRQEINA